MRAGFSVALVTGDKDFFQLVADGVQVYNPRDEGTWYDEAGVLEKFGVRPDQVLDVMALMGDSIDNIKGVPGIGEKGARELIAAHGTLEALIEAAPTLTQKRYREALLANVESARSSRELARIRTDVPVTFDPEALRYRGATRERAYALFSSLGFRTLVTDFAPTAKTAPRDYAIVGSIEEVDALADSLRDGRTHRRGPGGQRRLGRQRIRRRLVVLDGARVGAVHPAGPFWTGAHAEPRRAGRVRTHRSGAGRRIDREGRARLEVRDRGSRPAGRGTARRRCRHDGRELSARRDPVEPFHRRPRARARRVQGGHGAGIDRQRREGRGARCRPGRVAARFRR